MGWDLLNKPPPKINPKKPENGKQIKKDMMNNFHAGFGMSYGCRFETY